MSQVSFSFSDILALAESIRQLSVASRQMRTGMWSALQSTVHFAVDPSLAACEKGLGDGDIMSGKQQEQDEQQKPGTPVTARPLETGADSPPPASSPTEGTGDAVEVAPSKVSEEKEEESREEETDKIFPERKKMVEGEDKVGGGGASEKVKSFISALPVGAF